jgi:hypothetical protein
MVIAPVNARLSPGAEGLQSQTFHFGERRVGETITLAFRLSNPHDYPVRITRIVKDCACLSITQAPVAIPGRQAVDVSVQVQLSMESDNFDAGAWLNFDRHPPVRLAARGRTVEDLPRVVDLGEFRRGEAVVRHIPYKPVVGRPCEITKVECDGRLLEATVRPSPSNSAVQMVVLSPAKDIAYGPFETHLGITTSEAAGACRSVRVVGRVVPPVEFVPAIVSVILEGPGRECRKEVRVRSNYGDPLRLVDFASDGDVTVDLAESRIDGQDIVLSLSLVAPEPDGRRVLQSRLSARVLAGARTQEISAPVYARRP